MGNGMVTRTETLMNVIRAKIASRALTPTDKLPSVRRFAEAMGVSPSTVVEAYDRLTAEGAIHARRGSGFYVTNTNLPPMALSKMGTPRQREVDPFWVSRQSLDADPLVLKPGCGWLPPDWMPEAAIRKALRAFARTEDIVLTNYGSTRGSLNLRRVLLGRFAEEELITTSEQILLTNSGTQAIDLICRLLLHPGDTVLVDDPCYFNFWALLRAHKVKIIGIPYTLTGPNTSAFEQAVTTAQPKLYITNSTLHNPTGASLSPQTAYQLLSIAVANNLTIVEDDIFADFEPTLSPKLATLDGLNHVIRIGSFSKTLSASIRCGYIAAREDWIEELVDLQVATNFGGPSPMAAEVIASVLMGSAYRKYMEDIRRRLTIARKTATANLEKLGIVPWVTPRGGFYLWCKLPDGLDSSIIARRCLTENVILAPGNVFSVSETAAPFIRFNVTQLADKRVFSVIEKAMHKNP